ncbi:hypothetical protein KBG31_02560 [Patescibacteria group bacterium]|nr:hypothetical protein [Patescibacteria group bacterium]
MKYLISEIERLYPDWYDKSSVLSYDDQRWIWENAPLPEEDKKKLRELRTNGNAIVNESVNGTCKLEVKSELNWHKSNLISELKRCNSDTPQNKIAFLLEEIFKFWISKNGHWLWVAQTYTARTINWVMAATVKEYLRGGIRKTPPAYFTYLLKFRKKRKQFRSTNDTRK